MAFNTAITGIKASQIELDVTGSNIANASTVGYKSSRTEFGDVYTTLAVGAGSTNTTGSGVTVTDIAQDYSAGTIEFTNNNLDLAIDGSGFFVLDDGQGGTTYSRAGGFELDSDGYVVNKSGKTLQGFGIDPITENPTTVVGALQVSETENPPNSTDNIDLSFNIDSRLDASGLITPFDPTNSSTFTYSTTIPINDSLGDEQTISTYLVEQAPVRERQTIVFGTPDATGDIEFNGQTITVGTATAAAAAAAVVAAASDITDADPRIASVEIDPDDSTAVIVTYFASAADASEVVVTDSAGVAYVSGLPADSVTSDARLSAAEQQAIEITDPPLSGTITIGGVSITVLNPTDSQSDVIDNIVDRESEIIEENPNIESITADKVNGRVLITYLPEEGDVDLLAVSDDNSITNTITVEDGDNSYLGVYQMFAYLDDAVAPRLLDIGRDVAPGASGTTEEGAILVVFDRDSGVLESINGEAVSSTGEAPTITITDPNDNAADPDDALNIDLDITGTTQFASTSIVKTISQDGYAKGDLIGVSFADDGTMVASYSNGQNSNLGIVALATFENQSGLQSVGDTEWGATLDSGLATVNRPGSGLNGLLSSGALEQSNVDLSEELVALIEAQRNFQANSKTLETENAVTQTILQIS